MLSPSCKALQHFTQVNNTALQSTCSAPMRTNLSQYMPAHASSSSCFNSTDINVTQSFQVTFCFAATFSQLNAQQVNLFIPSNTTAIASVSPARHAQSMHQLHLHSRLFTHPSSVLKNMHSPMLFQLHQLLSGSSQMICHAICCFGLGKP